jgi:putative membrane protein
MAVGIRAMTPRVASPALHAALLAFVAAVMAWSAIHPRDYFTWVLEVAPVPIALAAIAVAWPRWRFTSLVLVLIAIHAAILMVGGKYTYAHVPLFDWIRDAIGGTRNDYDRLGHFAQGFVPALAAREILLRRRVVRPGPWLFFLVTCVCLAVSAAYELVEWAAAMTSGEAADAFLGTQGDSWDTQWDMFTALCGALIAQVSLGRAHDRLLGVHP